MSNRIFSKGECCHCAGHLEFPAEAAGQTVDCPHCGQPIQLIVLSPASGPRAGRRLWRGACLLLFGALTIFAVAWWWFEQPGRPAGSPSTVALQPRVHPPVIASPPDEAITNDFAISFSQLEKTPGSSLVYLTGHIRNSSDRRRFAVKADWDLFDSDHHPVGLAKDYQPIIEPGGDWHFKALVLEPRAVSARLHSISEDLGDPGQPRSEKPAR